MLPELDGLEVLQRLRKYRDTPVVMLSACGAEQDRIEGFKGGADDYLPKPFNMTELLLRVEALLRRSKSNKVDKADGVLADGAQVSLSAQDLEQSTYFWLAQDNLRVMSQIVAREFQRIWPENAPTIRSNQMLLQKQISDYALKLDETLPEHDVIAVCLDNTKLQPLAQATYLPVERGM